MAVSYGPDHDERWELQRALDDSAAKQPAPNDYWEEMFCPVCRVIEVSDTHVMALWWDKEKPVVMSRDRFAKRLSYGSIPGTWANVHRNYAGKRFPWPARSIEERDE